MRINPDTHWTWYPDINGLQSLVRREANLPCRVLRFPKRNQPRPTAPALVDQ